LDDDVGRYPTVLAGVGNGNVFTSLLDPTVTLDARGPDHLWRCPGYSDLVGLVTEAYVAGVRIEALDSHLGGNRMLTRARSRVPADVELDGPVDGQTGWRVLTLRDGKFVHIQDLDDVIDATLGLFSAPSREKAESRS
jgi:hypothetical protein